MIFFAGIESSHRLTTSIFERCKECNQSNVQEVLVFQKYRHIYYVPFIPAGKEAVVRCRNCSNRIRERNFSLELFHTAEEVKRNVRTVWWTYGGILAIIAIALLAILSYRNEQQKITPLINYPKPGDLYSVNLNFSNYTLYEVDHLNKDTVFLIMNNFQVNKESELMTLASDVNFNSDPFPVLHYELIKMFRNGEIINVERNSFFNRNRISPIKQR